MQYTVISSTNACAGMFDTQVSVDTNVHICKHNLCRVYTCTCVCAGCLSAVGNEGSASLYRTLVAGVYIYAGR